MDNVIKLEATDYIVVGCSVRAVVQGQDRVLHSDFVGRSAAVRIGPNLFAVEIMERPLQGQSAEPVVGQDLHDAMKLQGIVAQYTPPAKGRGQNDGGADGVFRIDGQDYDLQVTSCPRGKAWGKAVATGIARVEFTGEQAAEWIAEAIREKSPPTYTPEHARRMILALDVRHAAILTEDDIVQKFHDAMPADDSWPFFQVWLVGPSGRAVRLR